MTIIEQVLVVFRRRWGLIRRPSGGDICNLLHLGDGEWEGVMNDLDGVRTIDAGEPPASKVGKQKGALRWAEALNLVNGITTHQPAPKNTQRNRESAGLFHEHYH